MSWFHCVDSAWGGAKVWVMAMLETTRYLTHRINPPFENNQNQQMVAKVRKTCLMI